MKKNIIFYTASILLILIIGASFLLPLFVTDDPYDTDLSQIKQAPSAEHVMGTDDRGRDLFSRVSVAARFSISIGLISTAVALIVGVTLGFLSGYFGGMIDSLIGLFVNITLAFPSLLLAIGLTAAMEPGGISIFIALVAVGWAGFARIVRAETLKLKASPHVDAARVMGAHHYYILLRHILPLCTSLLLTTASLRIATAILTESSLSFLGLGLQPPHPTLGGMVSQGRDYFRSAPWISLFPGAVITIIILCCNVIGENIRTASQRKFSRK